MHYLICLVLVLAFIALIKKTRLQWEQSMTSLSAWRDQHLVVDRNDCGTPDPPAIEHLAFYAQLLGAHLVFGITAALTDRATSPTPLTIGATLGSVLTNRSQQTHIEGIYAAGDAARDVHFWWQRRKGRRLVFISITDVTHCCLIVHR